MGEIIRRESPTARVPHRCDFCMCDILVGIEYNRDTMADSGDLYTWISHKECCVYAGRIMREHFLEEVGTGDFQDSVYEDYRNAFEHDDSPVFEKVCRLTETEESE